MSSRWTVDERRLLREAADEIRVVGEKLQENWERAHGKQLNVSDVNSALEYGRVQGYHQASSYLHDQAWEDRAKELRRPADATGERPVALLAAIESLRNQVKDKEQVELDIRARQDSQTGREVSARVSERISLLGWMRAELTGLLPKPDPVKVRLDEIAKELKDLEARKGGLQEEMRKLHRG